MTAPAALFGDGAALDAGIERLCGDCPRYRHCAIPTEAWAWPERDVPAWTAGGGVVVCAERGLPVPEPYRLPSYVYPAGARWDRNGYPLGHWEGAATVLSRQRIYHGR